VELYQAEWCPHSHKVRQRLTEIGADFVARQVAADPDDRDALERATGSREIPVLVTDDGRRLSGEEEILPYLDGFDDRPDADAHRARSREEVGLFAP
jgi:glutaredoxin